MKHFNIDPSDLKAVSRTNQPSSLEVDFVDNNKKIASNYKLVKQI